MLELPGERDHLVVSEVCTMFECNEATLRRWRRQGKGPSYIQTPSGTILYPRKALEEYVAKQTRATS